MMKKIFTIFFVALMVSFAGVGEIQSQAMVHDCEEVKGIFVEQSEYTLSRNGMGAFCSVYAQLGDGVILDITEEAEYMSSDETIVTVYNGTLRGEGKGTAVITVAYHGYTDSVSVTVENEIDLDRLERELLQHSGVELSDNASYQNILNSMLYQISGTAHTRSAQDILSKAVAMKNIEWTPTQDLKGWNKSFTFSKSMPVNGIPYSQDIQVDDIEFPNALKKDDFYAGGKSANDGTYCPKYGVDCSRYVSYALGIDARVTSSMISDLKNGTGQIAKIGSYNVNSPSETDLLSAYQLTGEGNALVHQGHAMLIVYNDKNAKEITVYETTYKTPFMATYTYSYLAGKNYLPFKAK